MVLQYIYLDDSLNASNRQESGLPFYDVIFAKGLPKVASLPVATSQLVRTRLIDGTYDFDYIYFTESDQVTLCLDDFFIY